MTDQHIIERQTTALLSEVAPSRAPDRLYADVLTSIGRTRQRTRWLAFLKESPMRTPSGVAVGSPTFRLASIAALTLALILVAAAAVATGASLLPKPELPAPYGVAGNGSIAFHKDGDIWVTNASGTDPRLLIGGASDDSYPLYSRDGTRLVFERRVAGEPARVMVANADGSNAIAIADIPGETWYWDWSPDGTQLVVVWAVDGMPVLSILTADGSQPARTVPLEDVRPFDYAEWLPPDGSEIIFKGFRPDDTRTFFAVAPDGTGLRPIGESTTEPHWLQGPSLSPDGSTITYWDFIDSTEYGAYLFQRDIKSGVKSALSLDPAFPGAGLNPRSVPDGTSLLFESGPHDKGFENATNPGQLVIAPVDGSAPARTIGPAYSGAIPWLISPDGKQVLQDRGPDGIWLIDIASGKETPTEDGLADPTWQRLAP